MLVNKSKAAKLAGVSRTTIHRYVKNGKLSATGGEIDTSELIRVFGTISETPATPVQSVTSEQPATPSVHPDQTAKIRELENNLDEVKQDRDSWRDQAQANQRLLENKSGFDRANRTDQFMIMGLIGAFIALGMFIWITEK